MWYITLLLICEFQDTCTHQSISGKEYLGFQNSLYYKLDRIFTQNNWYRICIDFFGQLVNNTDSFMMNIRNLSFSSELQLNTTRNQNSTGNSSVETQVSFIIACIVCFVGVSGNFATLVFFLGAEEGTDTSLYRDTLLFNCWFDGSYFPISYYLRFFHHASDNGDKL